MQAIQAVKLSKLKANPNNPRLIKGDKFKKLVASLREFPEMLQARPIVANKDNIVLGGNMRLKAAKEAGLTEVPVFYAETWTQEQEREFIIKDNVGFGEWDWDMLANEWDEQQLDDWGLDIPNFEGVGEEVEAEQTQDPMIKITFQTPEQLEKAEIEIQALLNEKYYGALMVVK